MMQNFSYSKLSSAATIYFHLYTGYSLASSKPASQPPSTATNAKCSASTAISIVRTSFLC